MSAAELLAGLRRELDQRAGLADLGRDRYDADVLVRLAIQRTWISVEKYAEAYRLAAGVAAAAQPWSEMYGYRSVLAHMLPVEINDDRVWFETVNGVDRLHGELHELARCHRHCAAHEWINAPGLGRHLRLAVEGHAVSRIGPGDAPPRRVAAGQRRGRPKVTALDQMC